VLRMFAWETRGFTAPGVTLILGRPELSEYVAAPQADNPKVAANIKLLTITTELREVRRSRVDSQRLCDCCDLTDIYNRTHFQR